MIGDCELSSFDRLHVLYTERLQTMVVSSAPMRISFVVVVLDMADFYSQYPGRVLSTAIDKYVFIGINHAPYTDHVAVRYSISEEVSHPSQLRHTRIREALLDYWESKTTLKSPRLHQFRRRRG